MDEILNGRGKPIDSKSEVKFTVKNFGINTPGTFKGLKGNIQFNSSDISSASFNVSIDANTVNTGIDMRDNHLKGEDYFDAEKYPTITFQSKVITKTDDNEFEVTGDLTIKDVTKPVTFEVEYNGKGKNPWGVEVYGFEAEAKINREEFGLTWNAALETGGVLVGKDIKIKAELEVNPAS